MGVPSVARFWSIGTRATAAVATSVAQSTEPVREAVEVYTRTSMIFGLVEPDGRRLSDILNSNTTLALRDARSTSLVPDVDGSQGKGWTRIVRDEILFVMPPAPVAEADAHPP